ncbi:MAG: hypothetical protein HC805_08375, partial [Alkalinema sp. RL_2_19]|nr:hypothetical protein [Alkalinema sp. RL_2_19]
MALLVFLGHLLVLEYSSLHYIHRLSFMNTHPNMFGAVEQPVAWPQKMLLNHRLIGFVLALWLGGSALLDFVVMPTLYAAG